MTATTPITPTDTTRSAADNDLVLDVRDAHKSYDEVQALCGAHLRLRRGDWVGLLGPNGAGKTTLVRAISGRVRLDAGSLDVLGYDAGDDPARRRLGVVPQELALYPMLTARENLSAFGALHGVGNRSLGERIDWALEWTGLASRANEPVKRFSGGMKRRLNIACGVLHKPELVLLDEPTVGVDPQSRERIWQMLADLRAAGATLLLTTHQLDEAEQVCERIVIIDHGRTIADGTLSELIARTLGAKRQVTLVTSRHLPELSAENLTWTDDHHLLAECAEVARELPPLLRRIADAGGEVRDLHVASPSLQAVFLHLTGRELRE